MIIQKLCIFKSPNTAFIFEYAYDMHIDKLFPLLT